ncbi:hypothetical protein HBA55_35315 [Pseudomaricurvus alkylphenolicus]|uniref:carboxyl transferase domain-containing protein n=1 Tax=Pseudomaricurvus alkylphenolicus TaxID=1306991 RepID=UPI00141F58AD|nr:hypothetical protein [Pseudomaricurvus alkylphenolicus]
MRLEGKPFGVICNDCKVLGGAIDAEAAEKAANFINLCSSFNLPLVSLCDTPGFMVGPESEAQGAARKMAAMFTAGAKMKAPIVTIFMRNPYCLVIRSNSQRRNISLGSRQSRLSTAPPANAPPCPPYPRRP